MEGLSTASLRPCFLIIRYDDQNINEHPGTMKNFIRIITLASLPILLTACATGPVENKRAPGPPGEKSYQLQIGNRWITVTEQDWDRCEMFEPFPPCRTSTDQ